MRRGVSFDELMDIFFRLFHISNQDCTEMRALRNSGELYEILLKYETRHDSDRYENLGNAGQRYSYHN